MFFIRFPEPSFILVTFRVDLIAGSVLNRFKTCYRHLRRALYSSSSCSVTQNLCSVLSLGARRWTCRPPAGGGEGGAEFAYQQPVSVGSNARNSAVASLKVLKIMSTKKKGGSLGTLLVVELQDAVIFF
jgi:hypothetical protein